MKANASPSGSPSRPQQHLRTLASRERRREQEDAMALWDHDQFVEALGHLRRLEAL
jgi:hypothetical protein